ncbi:MAG: phosphoglucomutase/phosphomannomutase family protein [Candidatus Dormibacteria bacterium]
MAEAPFRVAFGTDGWRGVIADDFTFDHVRAAALGIARHLRANSASPLVVVGHDTRFAGDRFALEVAAICQAEGVRALLVDQPAPTQVVSWTVIDRGATGGVMLTASHNPAEFNGVKIKSPVGGSAPPEMTSEVEAGINRVLAEGGAASRVADTEVERINPGEPYFQQLGTMLDLPSLRAAGLRVVFDPMHGAGGGYGPAILGGGATTVTEVRGNPDPNFGGVHPEPIVPNLGPLLDLMGRGGHDLGIANDGDADRLGVVDERGAFVDQLQVYALLLMYLLEIRGWRGPAIRTLTSTGMADKLAAQYNIPVVETMVGFKYVGPKMTELDAIMGGEESGGFGFRGHIPERDGILAGLMFADMILRYGKPLSEIQRLLQSRVGEHHYDRFDVHLPREDYALRRARIYAAFSGNPPSQVAGQKVVRTRDDDGFKMYFANGDWVLVRGSGTEPVLRVYSEATSADTVREVIAEMRQRIEDIP